MDSVDGEAVLRFWFGARPGEAAYGQQRAVWFQKDAGFDAAVRRELGPAHERALAGGFADWRETPRGALANVILLDQVPRNIFRGSPRAYAGDALALALAAAAVDRGFDRALLAVERMFLYLPFEHSESLAAQRRALELFGQIDALPETKGILAYARRHHDIVARFGRFPHRNAALGRETTAEEAAFLREPGSSF
jgi:uncharacterized protein (DUF924 family)